MLRNKSIITSIFLILFLSSCGLFNKSPEKVAEAFLNCIIEKDYESAREYCTPETGKVIDLIESLERISDAKENSFLEGYKITSSRKEGEVVYVQYQEKNKEKPSEIRVVKMNGKWLVEVTKMDTAAKNIGSGFQEGESEPLEMEPEGENSDETTIGGQE